MSGEQRHTGRVEALRLLCQEGEMGPGLSRATLSIPCPCSNFSRLSPDFLSLDCPEHCCTSHPIPASPPLSQLDSAY